MNLFIFNFKEHTHFIESFLESASMAHKHSEKRTKDWFLWKFRDNPFGETVLACAEDNGEIIGCVAYGMQKFRLGEKSITSALAFENFVHPYYRRRGIFKKLIALCEKELLSREIDFLMVFPNVQSLPGYIGLEWKQLKISEYWIKGRNLLTIPLNVLDLKKSFNSNPSNLKTLQSPSNFDFKSSNYFESEITSKYLEWRFFTFPNSNYYYSETAAYDVMCRVGKRGRLMEAQVLFVNIKDPNEFRLADLLKSIQHNTKYDIVSIPISNNNRLRSILKRNLFIKVPNSTNVCYKILNENLLRDEDIEKISLSAINYHTY